MADDVVKEAAALIRSGRMAQAQARLEPYIEADPHHISAWLLEATTWPTVPGQVKVLELALKHNPGDSQLQSALAALQSPAHSSVPATAANPPAQSASPARPAPDTRRIVRWTLLGGVVCAILWVGFWWFISRPACESSPKNATPWHVLFIGNSYTSVNDLPTMFSRAACSGGYRVETGLAAPGGWTLAQHATDADTLGKLKQQPWDFVVLQEQSQIPASPSARTQEMYPAARQLVAQVRTLKAKPILFLTWGHQDGWPEVGLKDYTSMQAQLSAGYLGIAHELNVPVAPVGAAWSQVRTQAPDVGLWQADGNHPTSAGTYLAACVFYAALFRQSPVGLSYQADLPSATAKLLQTIAADTVLKDPAQWYLP